MSHQHTTDNGTPLSTVALMWKARGWCSYKKKHGVFLTAAVQRGDVPRMDLSYGSLSVKLDRYNGRAFGLGLRHNTRLAHLNLHRSDVNDESLAAIADGLEEAGQGLEDVVGCDVGLRSLSLSDCNVSSGPILQRVLRVCSSLTSLDLSHNIYSNLKEVLASLHVCPTLTDFSCGHRSYTKADVEATQRYLSKQPGLRCLRLRDVYVLYGGPGAFVGRVLMSGNTVLQCLDMRGNGCLPDKDVNTPTPDEVKAVTHVCALRELDVSGGCDYGITGWAQLCAALERMSLTKLCTPRRTSMMEGQVALASYVQRQGTSVQKLDVIASHEVVVALTGNTRLTELSMRGYGSVGDIPPTAILPPSIQALKCTWDTSAESSIDYICRSLPTLCHLHSLTLHHDAVTDAYVVRVMQALTGVGSSHALPLRELCLFGVFGDPGMGAVAAWMSDTTLCHLSVLRVSCTWRTHDDPTDGGSIPLAADVGGRLALMKAVGHSPWMRVVSMEASTLLDVDHVVALAESIASCAQDCVLEEVLLEGVRALDDGAIAWAHVLPLLPRLRVLDMYMCGIEDDGRLALYEACKVAFSRGFALETVKCGDELYYDEDEPTEVENLIIIMLDTLTFLRPLLQWPGVGWDGHTMRGTSRHWDRRDLWLRYDARFARMAWTWMLVARTGGKGALSVLPKPIVHRVIALLAQDVLYMCHLDEHQPGVLEGEHRKGYTLPPQHLIAEPLKGASEGKEEEEE